MIKNAVNMSCHVMSCHVMSCRHSFKFSRLSYCKNLLIKSIYILSVLFGYFNFDNLSGKNKNPRFVINKIIEGVIYE